MQEEAPAARATGTADHISTTAASFRDFLLKPEILRAINDCAFEHPSKGKSGDQICVQRKVSHAEDGEAIALLQTVITDFDGFTSISVVLL